MIFNISTSLQDAIANAITTKIDAGSGPGTVNVYDGNMPSTPNTIITDQKLLCTIVLNKPSFSPSSSGIITLQGAPIIGTAIKSGLSTWARIQDSDGNAVFDCDVAISNAVVTLVNVNIINGGPLRIDSFSITG